ncbi:DUF5753 domain-containing protein [Nonomuraea sp. M3C6]|uniref:DUF5753 domain-containing protein n=1 Tax=Nonomuraea marmarensis TaxID=3351344 RepID=A0ABW7AS97_9ACTN
MLVPGLLQTEQYARAVLRAEPGATEEKVEEALKARLRRQSIYGRPNPPMVQFVMDEGILYRPVGGEAVMYQQLTHLLTMMDHPNITIQVVPLSVGVNCGLMGGFAIAHVPRSPDTAYLSAPKCGTPSLTAQKRANSTSNVTQSPWRHVGGFLLLDQMSCLLRHKLSA